MLEDSGKVIVKSSTGPSFVVNPSRKVKNENLTPGMRVALNQRTFAIMEILPTYNIRRCRRIGRSNYGSS